MRLIETNRFKKTVKVMVPDPNKPDVTRPHSFVAEFETMTREELEQFVAAGKSVSELLDKILVSVEGIEDANGEKMDAAAALELVKRNVLTSVACRDVFWESTQGARKS